MQLLLLHLFKLKHLFAFFKDVFSHFHCLLEVLVTIHQNLLECLLIELNHLLLVLKHTALLLLLPVWLLMLWLGLLGPVSILLLLLLLLLRSLHLLVLRLPLWLRWLSRKTLKLLLEVLLILDHLKGGDGGCWWHIEFLGTQTVFASSHIVASGHTGYLDYRRRIQKQFSRFAAILLALLELRSVYLSSGLLLRNSFLTLLMHLTSFPPS